MYILSSIMMKDDDYDNEFRQVLAFTEADDRRMESFNQTCEIHEQEALKYNDVIESILKNQTFLKDDDLHQELSRLEDKVAQQKKLKASLTKKIKASQEEHMKALTTFESVCSEYQESHNHLNGTLAEIERQKQTLAKLEESRVTLASNRQELRFLTKITSVLWKADVQENEVEGVIIRKDYARHFHFSSKEMTTFEIANQIWYLMDEN